MGQHVEICKPKQKYITQTVLFIQVSELLLKLSGMKIGAYFPDAFGKFLYKPTSEVFEANMQMRCWHYECQYSLLTELSTSCFS